MILNEDVCGKYKDFEPFKMECNVFHVGCQACWFSLWTDFPPSAQFILFQINICVVAGFLSAYYTVAMFFATLKPKLVCKYQACCQCHPSCSTTSPSWPLSRCDSPMYSH